MTVTLDADLVHAFEPRGTIRQAGLAVRDVVQNVETAKVECRGGAAFVVGPVRDGDER